MINLRRYFRGIHKMSQEEANKFYYKHIETIKEQEGKSAKGYLQCPQCPSRVKQLHTHLARHCTGGKLPWPEANRIAAMVKKRGGVVLEEGRMEESEGASEEEETENEPRAMEAGGARGSKRV